MPQKPGQLGSATWFLRHSMILCGLRTRWILSQSKTAVPLSANFTFEGDRQRRSRRPQPPRRYRSPVTKPMAAVLTARCPYGAGAWRPKFRLLVPRRPGKTPGNGSGRTGFDHHWSPLCGNFGHEKRGGQRHQRHPGRRDRNCRDQGRRDRNYRHQAAATGTTVTRPPRPELPSPGRRDRNYRHQAVRGRDDHRDQTHPDRNHREPGPPRTAAAGAATVACGSCRERSAAPAGR